MPYYGPKKVKCPKCNKTHTIMYGDVIEPDFAYLCICKSCRPSFFDLLSGVYDWFFGEDNKDSEGSSKSKLDQD